MLVYQRVPPLGEGLEYSREPYIACEAHHGIVRSVHVAQLADNQALMELVHKARFLYPFGTPQPPLVAQVTSMQIYTQTLNVRFIFTVNVGKYINIWDRTLAAPLFLRYFMGYGRLWF